MYLQIGIKPTKARKYLIFKFIFVEGKFFLFPNRIWGNQAETQRWALEIKPKGYRCGVSPPK